MAGTSASTTDDDLEAARTRIRARLALAFVLDEVEVAGRGKRLAAIVGATTGPTKPLDAAAAQLVIQGAARVDVPALVEAALAHAGAAREDGRRLVRAVAWLEGRPRAHVCDVLVVDALSRTSDTPVRAAIDRALGGAKRAEWLASGIEGALRTDAERKEQATDARGQLLYLDSLGRPTAERCERIARTTSRGAPLYAPPHGVGFGSTGEAYTEDDLWRVHFANVPHGERRLREWTLDPLHRAFDERPRGPVERPAQVEPGVVRSRAADLASVLAYADTARSALLALPMLAAHEPLFVDRNAANEIAEAARAALAALGRIVATLRERIDLLTPGTTGAPTGLPAPDDLDCEAVPTAAWPLVFSLTGGPLPARIAAVRELVESLPTGLAPAPTDLAWPEPSIRDPVLDALAGSDLRRIPSHAHDQLASAVLDVLEVISAAQRTHRRAHRALSALSHARPAVVPPSASDDDAASDEAARLATELVARSIAERARARFARVPLSPPAWHRPALGDEFDAHDAIRLVVDDTRGVTALTNPQLRAAARIAGALEHALGPPRRLRVALMTLGVDGARAPSLRIAWLALVRYARVHGLRVCTAPGVRENAAAFNTAHVLATSNPCVLVANAGVHGHTHVVDWALLQVIDDWGLENTDVIVVQESLRLAQDRARELRGQLGLRGVRLFALVGELSTADVVELTAPPPADAPA